MLKELADFFSEDIDKTGHGCTVVVRLAVLETTSTNSETAETLVV